MANAQYYNDISKRNMSKTTNNNTKSNLRNNHIWQKELECKSKDQISENKRKQNFRWSQIRKKKSKTIWDTMNNRKLLILQWLIGNNSRNTNNNIDHLILVFWLIITLNKIKFKEQSHMTTLYYYTSPRITYQKRKENKFKIVTHREKNQRPIEILITIANSQYYNDRSETTQEIQTIIQICDHIRKLYIFKFIIGLNEITFQRTNTNQEKKCLTKNNQKSNWTSSSTFTK